MNRVIWPERRTVSDATVQSWYEDAVANGEIAEEYLGADTIKRMRQGLDDAGLVTFASDSDTDEDHDWRAGHQPAR